MSTVCSRYFSIAAAACSAARNKRDIVQDRSYFSERSSPASWRRQACAPTALPPSWARTRPSVPCGPDGHSRHCLPKRNTKSLSNFHHTSQRCSFQHLHSHNSMQRQIHHSTCMLRRVDSAGQLFHTSAATMQNRQQGKEHGSSTVGWDQNGRTPCVGGGCVVDSEGVVVSAGN